MNEFYTIANEKISFEVKFVHILLFIATQKINKHTYQLISVNALGSAHKTIQFMQSSSYKNIISLKMRDINI